MPTLHHTFLTATLFAMTAGCVSSKKHEELENAYMELESSHADLQARLAEEAYQNQELGEEVSDLSGQKDALLDDVARKELALRKLRESQQNARARVDAYRDLVERFASMIDAGTLAVAVVDGRMVVQLPTDILFPSGTATLSEEGRAQLMEVGEVLAGLDRDFQIEGHTDPDPISTERFPSNWALASGRATSVVEVLTQAGVPEEQLSTAGFADNKPVASNETDAGKAQNRRIEIVLRPDLSLMPGFEELKAADDAAASGEEVAQ